LPNLSLREVLDEWNNMNVTFRLTEEIVNE
jgi:hypothetical protein